MFFMCLDFFARADIVCASWANIFRIESKGGDVQIKWNEIYFKC